MAENEIMNRAGDIFTKKYGPLPLWAWMIIAGVTAYSVRKLIANRSDQQPPDDSGYVVDSDGNVFPSAYKGTGGGLPFGSGVNTSAGSTGTLPTPITEVSNEGWIRRAAEKVGKVGAWDNIAVQTALAAYISGATLDQRQQAIVNYAIKVEGQPPINVTPGKTPTNGGPPIIVRLVQNAGNKGWWAEYSDGTKRTVKSPSELSQLGSYPRTVLPSNDPFWSSQRNVGPDDFFTVSRLVRNTTTGGWWAVKPDGTIVTVKDIAQLNALRQANPNAASVSLKGTDPFWKSRGTGAA